MLARFAQLFRKALPPLQTEAARLAQENEHLKREARRYANIINCSLNPIWQRDAELKITFCNLAFSEVVEDTADHVIALGDMELYKGHRELARRALESGKEQTERRHIVVNGERRLYMIREVPFAKEGVVIGYAKDISELENAESEIQRHISALSDLLEVSTSAMAIYGRDMRMRFYNFAFATLFKLDEIWLDTEPTYADVLEALREKRRLPEQANFKAFKEHQLKLFTTLIEPTEEFFYLPDGKTLRAIAIPHALGGILFAYEDVTDRLALERSYNTLIAVQRETLDNLHEGIVVFGEDGRLTLSNPTFLKLWHLPAEFVASEPHIKQTLERCRPLFVTEDWEAFVTNLVARFQQRQFFALRFERADGSVLDCTCVPLPDGATLLSFIDVTASTVVERSLRERAQALEEADKLKTEFLANMSYELRSPLTSISGFAEILAKQYVGELNAAQKEYVTGIYQSSQQLATLISDIIDLASIQAGFLKLDLNDFELHKTVEAALAVLTERAKNQAVEVKLALDSSITTMRGDEVRIRQVLVNLISNAIKYAKHHIEIKTVAEAGGITFSVFDDGKAIEPERQEKLFEPFARGALKRGADAALGLSVVKRLVELHGGKIRVDSREGVGTRIICQFSNKPAE